MGLIWFLLQELLKEKLGELSWEWFYDRYQPMWLTAPIWWLIIQLLVFKNWLIVPFLILIVLLIAISLINAGLYVSWWLSLALFMAIMIAIPTVALAFISEAATKVVKVIKDLRNR